MSATKKGPRSPQFDAVAIKGNARLSALASAGVSPEMVEAAAHAPHGSFSSWGLPFHVNKPLVIRDEPVTVKLDRLKARWLVFMHTADVKPLERRPDGFIESKSGRGRLGEHVADYVIRYADGQEQRIAIRRQQQVSTFARNWGEHCTEAVSHLEPYPLQDAAQDRNPNSEWGYIQFRTGYVDCGPWINWLWAWENPRPNRPIEAIRFEPVDGAIVISGLAAGDASSTPLRWQPRRRAILRLDRGKPFDPHRDAFGLLKQIQLDMGQIISAVPRPLYPDRQWEAGYNNKLPDVSQTEVLVEYTAHPDARFHLPGGRTIPVARLELAGKAGPLQVVPPATQRVTIRVVEKGTDKPVAVKLHVHGKAGEYLAPLDRHRIPNPFWFQDYSVDFTHRGIHHCTYIPSQTVIDLPLGAVYIEVSKGFEIRPVRKMVKVGKGTRQITIEIEKVLPWRERGWVSADTHVHFLSPTSAMLEGAGEGVNVVNLLASQWGELMTNVGDFDGRTTYGAKESGGDGEYLVRVGTENRQHVLGHISLLGYGGPIISPMTCGGPDESALGDPVEVLLTEWAAQCRRQGGVVVLPHFPNPRLENAAAIVSGNVDGVEMTSWQDLYSGIDPYSLTDWYRYLNCGYMTAAVGGTDKMTAATAVGTVRTYAKLRPDEPFTYAAWMDAVRRAATFVTYGPLLEFAVEGRKAGTRMQMPSTGGTVSVSWKVASVTVPMSRVDLVVSGEIRESQSVRADADEGCWDVRVDRSSWLALLVRGHYPDKPEIIAAHSSPVMIEVAGSPFMAAADALTILQQIEGALAYLDSIGTRAEDATYKRMRMVLTSAHRDLHNRMHREGRYHTHTPLQDHEEHHG